VESLDGLFLTEITLFLSPRFVRALTSYRYSCKFHWYYNLRSMRWHCQGNRQYRGPCGDQADTCTPSEKSWIKRIQPITREQGTAPKEFVRI